MKVKPFHISCDVDSLESLCSGQCEEGLVQVEEEGNSSFRLAAGGAALCTVRLTRLSFGGLALHSCARISLTLRCRLSPFIPS